MALSSFFLNRDNAAADVQTVSSKLDQVRIDIQAVDDELREHSLELALMSETDEIPGPILTLQGRRDALRNRETLLENALAEANRRRRKQENEAIQAAEKARLRALTQHRTAATKAAAQIGAGLEQAVAGWRALVDTVDKIDKAATQAEMRQVVGVGHYAQTLLESVACELIRLNAVAMRLHGAKRPFPFTDPRDAAYKIAKKWTLRGAWEGDQEPIDKRIGARFDIPRLYANHAEPLPAEPLNAADQAAEDANAVAYRAVYADRPEAAPAESATQGEATEPLPQTPPAETPPAETPLETRPSADFEDVPLPPEIVAAKTVLAEVQADPENHGKTPEEIRNAVLTLTTFKG